jgi:hypothetical protein
MGSGALALAAAGLSPERRKFLVERLGTRALSA